MVLIDNLFDLNLNQIPKTPEILSGAVSLGRVLYSYL